jgi:hypothetical protein
VCSHHRCRRRSACLGDDVATDAEERAIGAVGDCDGAGAPEHGVREAAVDHKDGEVGVSIRRVTTGPYRSKCLSRSGSTSAAEWRSHSRLPNSGTAGGPGGRRRFLAIVRYARAMAAA